MREKVVKKLLENGCTNIISLHYMIHQHIIGCMHKTFCARTL